MGLDIGAVNTSTHHLPGLVGPPPTDEQSRDASGPWAAVGDRPEVRLSPRASAPLNFFSPRRIKMSKGQGKARVHESPPDFRTDLTPTGHQHFSLLCTCTERKSVDTQLASNLRESLVDFRGHGASQRPRTSTRHSLAWAGQAHVQGSLLWLNDFPPPPLIRRHPTPHLASKVQTFTNHLFFYLSVHLQNVRGGDSV